MIYKCKYCDYEKYYFVKNTGKIERYGMYCFNCNRFMKWVPNDKVKNIPDDLIRYEVGKILTTPLDKQSILI